jgi:hypothetical protein
MAINKIEQNITLNKKKNYKKCHETMNLIQTTSIPIRSTKTGRKEKKKKRKKTKTKKKSKINTTNLQVIGAQRLGVTDGEQQKQSNSIHLFVVMRNNFDRQQRKGTEPTNKQPLHFYEKFLKTVTLTVFSPAFSGSTFQHEFHDNTALFYIW